MTWLFWLFAAMVVAALAALTGVRPRGGRKVAGTHLMGVARVVLMLIVVIVAFAVYRAQTGH